MPKIEYVINADMERIYPKTHEDAILTTDGYTLRQKFEMINEALGNKANVDHKHDFSHVKAEMLIQSWEEMLMIQKQLLIIYGQLFISIIF